MYGKVTLLNKQMETAENVWAHSYLGPSKTAGLYIVSTFDLLMICCLVEGYNNISLHMDNKKGGVF